MLARSLTEKQTWAAGSGFQKTALIDSMLFQGGFRMNSTSFGNQPMVSRCAGSQVIRAKLGCCPFP